jgi:hypothetical protein
LVERHYRKVDVAGSNPAFGSKEKRNGRERELAAGFL